MRQSNRSKQLKSRRLLLLNTLGLHDSQRYLYTWCWFQLNLPFPLTAIMFVSCSLAASTGKKSFNHFHWQYHHVYSDDTFTVSNIQKLVASTFLFLFIISITICLKSQWGMFRTGVSSCDMDYLRMLDIHGFGSTTLIVNLNSVFVWIISNLYIYTTKYFFSCSVLLIKLISLDMMLSHLVDVSTSNII